MLKETTAELAIIAAPHKFHVDSSVQCLRNGMHVLCEKPMAMATAECDSMIEAAEKAGRLLAVGHFRRFYPSCETIKRILDSEVLGQVRSFHFYDGQNYGWPAQSAFPFKKAEAGGGVLIDQGAHAIDLLMWWLGEPRKIAYQDDAMGGVEVNCRLDLTMANGAIGVLQLSRDWPLPNRCVIRCDKGWVGYMCDVMDRIDWGLYESGYAVNAQLRRAAIRKELFPDMSDAVPNDMEIYFTSQLRNVIAAVRGVEPVRVSGVDARKTIAVIENCYRNRTLLHMPWLDEAELRRAREMAHAG